MALIYISLENKKASDLHFTKVLTYDKQSYPKETPEIIVGYKSLNIFATAQQERLMVESYYKQIMNIYDESWIFVPEKGTGYSHLNSAYNANDIQNKELEYFFKALSIDEKVLGKYHNDIAVNHHIIGSIYAQNGNTQLAQQHYDQALKIYRLHLPDNHIYIKSLLNPADGSSVRAIKHTL